MAGGVGGNKRMVLEMTQRFITYRVICAWFRMREDSIQKMEGEYLSLYGWKAIPRMKDGKMYGVIEMEMFSSN
jgi:hypothetical protein